MQANVGVHMVTWVSTGAGLLVTWLSPEQVPYNCGTVSAPTETPLPENAIPVPRPAVVKLAGEQFESRLIMCDAIGDEVHPRSGYSRMYALAWQ